MYSHTRTLQAIQTPHGQHPKCSASYVWYCFRLSTSPAFDISYALRRTHYTFIGRPQLTLSLHIDIDLHRLFLFEAHLREWAALPKNLSGQPDSELSRNAPAEDWRPHTPKAGSLYLCRIPAVLTLGSLHM
jgi:hypothetical protein